jgi:hypothetical protein
VARCGPVTPNELQSLIPLAGGLRGGDYWRDADE